MENSVQFKLNTVWWLCFSLCVGTPHPPLCRHHGCQSEQGHQPPSGQSYHSDLSIHRSSDITIYLHTSTPPTPIGPFHNSNLIYYLVCLHKTWWLSQQPQLSLICSPVWAVCLVLAVPVCQQHSPLAHQQSTLSKVSFKNILYFEKYLLSQKL